MVGVNEKQVLVAAELVQQLTDVVLCAQCSERGARTCGQQCGRGARGQLAGHVRRLRDCLPTLPAASLQVFSEVEQEVRSGAGVPFLLRGPVGRNPAPPRTRSPPAPSRRPQDIHISIRVGGTLTRVTVGARGKVSVRTHTERLVQTSPPRVASDVPLDAHHPRDNLEIDSNVFSSAPLPPTPAPDSAPAPPPEVDTPSSPAHTPPEPELEESLESDSENVVEGTPHNTVPVVSWSCLEAAARGELARVSCARGWRLLPQYSSDLTHLVVGVDDAGRAQRSVKYMRALAAGKWIVGPSWLRSAGEGSEEHHEALDFSGDPGPALARRAVAAGRPLLRGLRFLLRPPYDVLDETSLAGMVRDAGGETCGEGEGVVLLGEDADEDAAPAALRQRVLPLSVSWVLDSLGRQTLQPPGDSLMCPRQLLSPPAQQCLRMLEKRAGHS